MNNHKNAHSSARPRQVKYLSEKMFEIMKFEILQRHCRRIKPTGMLRRGDW
jgi:hypothetical protein